MLKPFLPDAEHGHILITSRAQDFQDLGILNPVELERIARRGRDRVPPPSLRPRGCRGRGTRRGRAARPRAGRAPARPGAGGRLHRGERGAELPDAISRVIAAAGLKRLEARRPALGNTPVGGHHLGGQLRGGAGGIASRRRCVAAQCLPRPGRHPVRTRWPRGSRTRGLGAAGPRRGRGGPALVHDLLQPLGRFSLVRIDGETRPTASTAWSRRSSRRRWTSHPPPLGRACRSGGRPSLPARRVRQLAPLRPAASPRPGRRLLD